MIKALVTAVILTWGPTFDEPPKQTVKSFTSIEQCRLWKRQKSFEFLPSNVGALEVFCIVKTGESPS